jgi:ribosomal protein L11 methyltransferase
MRRLVQRGDRVLDVGTGSGVLAVASVMLGAASAIGTDINPASLDVVRLNASLNGTSVQISATLDTLDQISEPFDLVVANILAPVLLELAPDLARLSNGMLVVSGLLETRYEHVLEALAPFHPIDREVIDGWISLALAK